MNTPPKSKGVSVVGPLNDRDPLIALIAALRRANEILHLIKWMITENGIFLFSDKMSAILLKKIVHSRAIPPVEAKEYFSISQMYARRIQDSVYYSTDIGTFHVIPDTVWTLR